MNRHAIESAAAVALALLLTPAAGFPSAPAGGPGTEVHLREGTSFHPGMVRQEARQTPASPDSLYRAGRAALNDGRYRRASRLFGDLTREHPDVSQVPDALYWRALALYRLGGESDLREGLADLDRLRSEYPDSRTVGDASTLATRIRGLLARSGDADAAAEIMQSAGVAEEEQADVGADMDMDVEMDDAEADVQAAVDSEVRVAALNALLQMDSDRALPILENILRDCPECSADLRRRALFMLAQEAGDSTATELLLETARSEPDPEVRKQAVFWLSEVDDPRALDALSEVLASPADSSLHEQAAFALAQHGGEEAVAALRSLVRDETASTELRGRAIYWLGQEEGSGEFLRGLFDELSDPELREKVLLSVAEGEVGANRSWLIAVASDEANPPSVRKKALFWAGQVDGPLGPLTDLYGTLDDRELKEQVVFSVGQSEAEGATDWLIDVARNEDVPELRKHAIFWLGQSDDPRAADALLEIIGSSGTP